MFCLSRWQERIRGLCIGLAAVSALAFWTGRAEALETSLSAPGASEELTENFTGASAVMAAQSRGLEGAQEVLAAALSDYRTLVQVAYDAGFFSPIVSIKVDGREAASIPPLNAPSSINRIDITVEPGRPFTFGTARVAPLPPDAELPEGFVTGAPATTAMIQDAAFTGTRAWREAGYAKAKVSGQRITANHGQALLNAEIDLAQGPKLKFGDLQISGNTDVREEALRRIAGFPTGEEFHPDKLQKVGTRLRRTGTFASVAIKEGETPNADGTLDVYAEFEDLPKRQISFGAELSSNTGLDLTFDWTHRNLFNGAERLRLETRLRNIGSQDSDIGGRIALRLDQPASLGPDDNIYYQIDLERLDELHYSALRGGLGIGVRRVFSDNLFAEAGIGLDIHRTKDVFGDRRFKYVGLPIRVEADHRDNKLNATRGTYVDARLIPFAGFSGTTSGATFLVDGRGYLSLNQSGSLVLAGRAQWGSTAGPALNDVSPLFLFFSGGANSVRGQPYQSLGVLVPGGIAGGRGYLALSGELRGEVTDTISLVGFYDIGFVDADPYVSASSEYHSGAGIGVRYNIGGFGALRLDLAWPVEGYTSDGFQFYIGIGQAF